MAQGILGGLLVVFLVVVIYRLCARVVPPDTAAAPRTVRTVLVATVTAVLAHASVEPTLTGYTMAVLFAWFLAWLTLQDPRGRAAEGIGATAAPGPAAGPPPAAATP